MKPGGSVRLSRMFCPAQDRNVPILLQDPSPGSDAGDDTVAPVPMACLEYGIRCSGWLCPHFAVPTLPPDRLLEEAMAAELARKGRRVREGRAILERALREKRVLRQGALEADRSDRRELSK